MILIAGQNASFLVFTYALFKEICFSLNRNHVHEVKRVGGTSFDHRIRWVNLQKHQDKNWVYQQQHSKYGTKKNGI